MKLTKRITKKDYPFIKQELFDKQNGLCCLCGRPLEDDLSKHHLDHDHSLTGDSAGRVRGLLHHNCNNFEGVVKHKFGRSGLKNIGVDYIQFLRGLADYLEKDYREAPVHDKFAPDKVKWFSRQTKPDMVEEMQLMGFSFTDTMDRKALTASYRKQLLAMMK